MTVLMTANGGYMSVQYIKLTQPESAARRQSAARWQTTDDRLQTEQFDRYWSCALAYSASR